MSEPIMLSAIDRALAAAKARKAAKEAAGLEPEVTVAPKAKKDPAAKASKIKVEKVVDAGKNCFPVVFLYLVFGPPVLLVAVSVLRTAVNHIVNCGVI